MKKISALPLQRFALALSFSFSVLFFLAGSSRAEQRLALTSHVPAGVSSGIAPMIGQVPATQHLHLAISLPLQNETELHELLQRIYDPQSSSFRQYLSVQEFTEKFGPSQSDYEALLNFAQANGLAVVDKFENRMVLDVEGPAAKIESAFHVTLGLYQHPTEARTFYAPDREPTTDAGVPVLHISGLDNYSRHFAKNVRPAQSQSERMASKTTGSGPGGDFIGSDLRAAYYGAGKLDGAGQTVGLYEEAGYELSDVVAYFKKFNQPLRVPVSGVSVNGANLRCPPSTCDDGEQALDIEYSISMAPRLSGVIVYVGPSTSEVAIFNKMATDNIAKQVSCSWGWADDETTLDPVFLEMMAQGQSIFVATGDQGSGTQGDVVFPADDPYVTAVGGTDLVTNGAGGTWKSETGWSGSAGSPSKNKVPIPSYQQLPGVINSENKGSTTLRNYPDVAAEANTVQYICDDGSCSGGWGGTSFAAPQWAGFIAMANQQLLAHGGTATLGFLNPAIYNIGVGTGYDSDFHDIVSGSNGGYNAVTGYDLVTGWGSPTGADLIDALTETTRE